MEVIVTASTTDKLRAERNAQAMMEAGYSDPLSFYEDMGIPDAEERAERLFWKDTNPQLYYQKYILKKDISELANQVISAQGVAGGGMAGQGAMSPGGATPAQAPMVPSPEQAGNVATTPQASPRNLIQQAAGGVRKMFGV
jgi:hypothetical protein